MIGRTGQILNSWANREHRASRRAEEFFGNGAQQEFPNTSAAMGAGHKQVNVVFIDDLGEYLAHFPMTNVRVMRKGFQAQRKLLYLLLRAAVRALVDRSNGYRINGARPHNIEIRQ